MNLLLAFGLMCDMSIPFQQYKNVFFMIQLFNLIVKNWLFEDLVGTLFIVRTKKIRPSLKRALTGMLFYWLTRLFPAVLGVFVLAPNSLKADYCDHDKIFKTSPHTNGMLRDMALKSMSISPKTAYVLVKITSRELFDRTKIRISFHIEDHIHFTAERIQIPNSGQVIHHPALSWCPGLRYEELRIGQLYVFVVEIKDGTLLFDPISQIYEWNAVVRNRFEQLKRTHQAGKLGTAALAETIKEEVRKNPGGGIALFELNVSRIAKQDMRRVGYEAYVAANSLYAAHSVLTDEQLPGADPPNSEHIFRAALVSLQLKEYSAARDHLNSFFKRQFGESLRGKNGALLDVPYWLAFLDSTAHQQLSSKPEELEKFVSDWTLQRACGAMKDERRREALLAWDKQLSGFNFFTACNLDPSGTTVWFSSLPSVKGTNSNLIKILAKPYKIAMESADVQRQAAVLASFAVFPRDEEQEPIRKRVIRYQVECKNGECSYKTMCQIEKSAYSLMLRLPVNPDPRKSQMEHEFMRLIFGISKDFARFKKLLQTAREDPYDIDIDPYPSSEGYEQLIKDVKSACKF